MRSSKKRWSEWEDKRLVDLIVGQRLPLREVSRLLGRTESAVRGRSEKLKNEKQTKRDSIK